VFLFFKKFPFLYGGGGGSMVEGGVVGICGFGGFCGLYTRGMVAVVVVVVVVVMMATALPLVPAI